MGVSEHSISTTLSRDEGNYYGNITTLGETETYWPRPDLGSLRRDETSRGDTRTRRANQITRAIHLYSAQAAATLAECSCARLALILIGYNYEPTYECAHTEHMRLAVAERRPSSPLIRQCVFSQFIMCGVRVCLCTLFAYMRDGAWRIVLADTRVRRVVVETVYRRVV